MQRCPKCGYSERVDWPGLLGLIAFLVLYSVWMLDYRPRELRGLGLAAFIAFLASNVWRILKSKDSKRKTAEGLVPKAPSQ